MIGKLTGTLLEKNPPEVLVDCAGVGYEVQVPMGTFYNLPAIGERVSLLTQFIVREDAQLLYGFASAPERAAFRQLIKISGIGPRMALSPASISCRCCSLIGRSAISYSACSNSSPWVALALAPSTLNCSWRWAMWMCSAASMVRKWLSAGPHRLPRRVLLWGRKVWRRIKVDNSGLWLPTGSKGLQ